MLRFAPLPMIVSALLASCAEDPSDAASRAALTDVDPARFHIFLLGGHSNMIGWDEPNADRETHPRAWAYRWWGDHTWNLAKDDRETLTNRGRGYGGASPAMAFLKQLVAVPEWQSETFGVIQTAAESATAQWPRFTAESNRYAKGQARFEEMVEAARANAGVGRLAGLVLHLGFVESDFPQVPVETYDSDLRLTIAQLREALGAPDLPVLLLKFEVECEESMRNPRALPLREEVRSVASDEAKIAYVDVPLDLATHYMPFGDHHFNAAGYRLVMAEAVRVLREKGWGPTSKTSPTPSPTPSPTTEPVVQAAEAQCACSSTTSRAPLWLLLLGAPLAFRRRRARGLALAAGSIAVAACSGGGAADSRGAALPDAGTSMSGEDAGEPVVVPPFERTFPRGCSLSALASVARQGGPGDTHFDHDSTKVTGGYQPGLGYWYEISAATKGPFGPNGPLSLTMRLQPIPPFWEQGTCPDGFSAVVSYGLEVFYAQGRNDCRITPNRLGSAPELLDLDFQLTLRSSDGEIKGALNAGRVRMPVGEVRDCECTSEGVVCRPHAGVCEAPIADACGATCTNLQNDHANCGACGKRCGRNEVCNAGACSRCRGSLCGRVLGHVIRTVEDMAVDASRFYYLWNDFVGGPIGVSFVPITGGPTSTIAVTAPTPGAGHLLNVGGLALADSHIYWAVAGHYQDYEGVALLRSTKAGGATEVFVGNAPGGVAGQTMRSLTRYEDRLYWALNLGNQSPRVCSVGLDVPPDPMTPCPELEGGTNASGLVAQNGLLLIGKTPVDRKTTIVVKELSTGMLRTLAQDVHAEFELPMGADSTHVYWSSNSGIWRAPRDGSAAPAVFATIADLDITPTGTALVVDGTRLYFTGYEDTRNGRVGGIFRVSLTDSLSPYRVTWDDVPFVVDATSVYLAAGGWILKYPK